MKSVNNFYELLYFDFFICLFCDLGQYSQKILGNFVRKFNLFGDFVYWCYERRVLVMLVPCIAVYWC